MTIKVEYKGESLRISGSKANLNSIATMLFSAGEYDAEHGYDALKDRPFAYGRQIHGALDAVGYYDDIKEEE